jgi:hypothetical protein
VWGAWGRYCRQHLDALDRQRFLVVHDRPAR